uniref:Uncharacterized protein n=1 Tax=Parastrongyloides trichosuri TaxID=131310 RepID=A0A0N4ZBF3_PARTI
MPFFVKQQTVRNEDDHPKIEENIKYHYVEPVHSNGIVTFQSNSKFTDGGRNEEGQLLVNVPVITTSFDMSQLDLYQIPDKACKDEKILKQKCAPTMMTKPLLFSKGKGHPIIIHIICNSPQSPSVKLTKKITTMIRDIRKYTIQINYLGGRNYEILVKIEGSDESHYIGNYDFLFTNSYGSTLIPLSIDHSPSSGVPLLASKPIIEASIDEKQCRVVTFRMNFISPTTPRVKLANRRELCRAGRCKKRNVSLKCDIIGNNMYSLVFTLRRVKRRNASEFDLKIKNDEGTLIVPVFLYVADKILKKINSRNLRSSRH